MALLDIVILGAGLNGYSLAADAASRGFSVTLLDVTNIPNLKEVNLPLVASEFMHSKTFDAAQLLKNLPEIANLAQRGPDICQWLPASVLLHSDTPHLSQQVSLFCYKKIRQLYHLPDMSEKCSQTVSHVDCVIYTDILTDATKILSQSKGATIEENAVVNAIKAQGQIWAFDFEDSEGEKKKLTSRSVINCTGQNTIHIAKSWFGYTSRCQIKTQWHHYLAYYPHQPSRQIYYLKDDRGVEYIHLPVTPNHVLIGSLAEKDESREDSFLKIKTLLETFHLPPLTESNIKEQFLIPSLHFTSDTQSSHQGYMIDLLCPEGFRPLVNIIGGNTSQCRLMAEQAIESLTDFLPARKPCQTKILPLTLDPIR